LAIPQYKIKVKKKEKKPIMDAPKKTQTTPYITVADSLSIASSE